MHLDKFLSTASPVNKTRLVDLEYSKQNDRCSLIDAQSQVKSLLESFFPQRRLLLIVSAARNSFQRLIFGCCKTVCGRKTQDGGAFKRQRAERRDGPLHLDQCKVIDEGIKCSGREPGDNGVNGVKKRRHGR